MNAARHVAELDRIERRLRQLRYGISAAVLSHDTERIASAKSERDALLKAYSFAFERYRERIHQIAFDRQGGFA